MESRGSLGGTCLNVGCIPSKALLHSSHLYEEANHDFAKHGIKISGVELDVPTMMESKAKAVSGLTGGIEYLFKKYGVDYLKGKGKMELVLSEHRRVHSACRDGREKQGGGDPHGER